MNHLLRNAEPPTPEELSISMANFLSDLRASYALTHHQVRSYARALNVSIEQFQEGTGDV